MTGAVATVARSGPLAVWLPRCQEEDIFLNVIVLVPQTEHVPLVAVLPFLRVTSFGSFIGRFFLHLRQYASISLPPV